MNDKTSPKERTKRRSIDWWLVALILLPMLYFLPELLGLNVFSGIDTTRLNMPLRFFDREAFASGALPLWNPYMFTGFPHLAESESGVFYPGNIFIHLPGDFFHWYSVEVVAHFIIAATGFYAWMRIRNNSRFASAFLAAIYCTTPFLIFHITAFGLFTSIVWLPWYMVIFESGLRSKHPVRTGLWLALLLAVMLMSGSIQAAFLGVFALLAYAIAYIFIQPDSQSRRNAFLRCLSILLPGLIAPVIAAIQLLPTAELSAVSERMAMETIRFYEVGTWLTIPRLASLVVFPAIENPSHLQDYGSSLCYIGAVPFIFAFSSIALYLHRRDRSWIPFAVVGVVTLILAFGLNLPGYRYLVEIPPFSIFRYPGRMAHVALTFFLPLAAPALDTFTRLLNREETEEVDSWWTGWGIGTVLVLVISAVGLLFGPSILRVPFGVPLFFSIMALFAWTSFSRTRSKAVGRPALLMVALLILLALGVQILQTYPFSRALVQRRGPFDESLQFFKDVRDEFPTDMEIPRICLAGRSILFDPHLLEKVGFSPQENVWDSMSGNASGLENVTSVRGLTPLNQYRWKLIMRDTLQTRIDTAYDRAIQSGTPPVADDISVKILRMLGVDVVLLEGPDWMVPGYELWRCDLALPFHEGLCAYKSRWHMSDAYFADTVRIVDDDYASFLRYLGSDDPPPDYMVYLEDDSDYPVGRPLGAPGGSIISRERGFNWMTFDVNVSLGSGVLVTGENFFPGWKAYVDDEETPIYRANFVQSAITVPSGQHHIEFRYEPRSVRVGMLVSLGGIAAWVILMLAVMWIHRRGRKTIVPSVHDDATG
jgi:hypothetical protein